MAVANPLPPRQCLDTMQLKDFLAKHSLSVAAVAKEWGISPSTLTRPINGQRWPSDLIMVRSHQLSAGQVGLEDWIETCRDLLETQGIIAPTKD